jgi:hypothetical protein
LANLAVTFDTYTVAKPLALTHNFGARSSKSQPLIGLDGGYDPFSSGPNPRDPGMVQVNLLLRGASADDLQGALDTIYALQSQGEKLLTYQPQGSLAARWCYAKLVNVEAPLDLSSAMLWQRVALSFAVRDPHWYGTEVTENAAASGVLTTGTITHAGSGTALCKVTVACGIAQTMTNPTIRRIVSGVTVDEVKYTGVVDNSETLIIDPRTKAVTLEGTGVFDDFTFIDPSWFRLLPGANTINIVATGAGSAATVTFAYYPVYI